MPAMLPRMFAGLGRLVSDGGRCWCQKATLERRGRRGASDRMLSRIFAGEA